MISQKDRTIGSIVYIIAFILLIVGGALYINSFIQENFQSAQTGAIIIGISAVLTILIGSFILNKLDKSKFKKYLLVLGIGIVIEILLVFGSRFLSGIGAKPFALFVFLPLVLLVGLAWLVYLFYPYYFMVRLGVENVKKNK